MINVDFKITLEQIEASGQQRVYWAIDTCWWTHDPKHLYNTKDVNPALKQQHGVPCDPRGSVLYEGVLSDFLRSARETDIKLGHYGKHGLRAFLTAHHLNSSLYGLPWSETTWQHYNDAIDRWEANAVGMADGLGR